MDPVSLKCVGVVVIFFSICLDISVCLIPSSNTDNAVEMNGVHQIQEKYPSMWWGWKMGKIKGAEKLSDKSKISDLLDSLNEYPWTLIAVNDNTDVEKRGNIHNFTPRLGRTLDEGRSSDDLAEVAERSGTFSPRLGRGRHFSPYSPRLGREESISYV